MTLSDLKKWIEAAQRVNIKIIRGPRPGDDETLTITLANVDQLVAEGRISLE